MRGKLITKHGHMADLRPSETMQLSRLLTPMQREQLLGRRVRARQAGIHLDSWRILAVFRRPAYPPSQARAFPKTDGVSGLVQHPKDASGHYKMQKASPESGGEARLALPMRGRAITRGKIHKGPSRRSSRRAFHSWWATKESNLEPAD